MKVLVELVDNNKLDVVVKGDRTKVIHFLVEAMERTPELAEALTFAMNEFFKRNKYPKPFIPKA